MRSPCLSVCMLVPAFLLTAVGCTPQDQYDNAITANRSLREQLAMSRDELGTLQQQRDRAMSDAQNWQTSYNTLEGRYGELNSSLADFEAAQEDYLRRIARLELGPLPADVEDAIQDLAVAHSQILSFEPQMGMLRFASDFSFDLGSADLNDSAAETVQRLAQILNSSSARSLEAHIVGHTDNVPIRKAETRRKHPTNRHLSVHRAISVCDALSSAGVDPARIKVAGYGEYRPIVANGAGGAAANRRVEIFLANAANAGMASVPTDASAAPMMPMTPMGNEPMK